MNNENGDTVVLRGSCLGLIKRIITRCVSIFCLRLRHVFVPPQWHGAFGYRMLSWGTWRTWCSFLINVRNARVGSECARSSGAQCETLLPWCLWKTCPATSRRVGIWRAGIFRLLLHTQDMRIEDNPAASSAAQLETYASIGRSLATRSRILPFVCVIVEQPSLCIVLCTW
jgi:hypothetical protein